MAAATLTLSASAQSIGELPTPYPSTGVPAFLPPPLLPPPPATDALPTPVEPAPVAAPPPVATPPVAKPADAAVVPSEATVVEAAVEPETEQVVTWYQPSSWFQQDPWDAGFELGLNGSTGTSESISLRTGGYVKGRTRHSKFNTSLYYNKTEADGVLTQSNAQFKARHDLLSEGTPWTLFTQNQVFYDEFQAFDLNVNINSGLGYRVFDTKRLKLTTSFGAGASREFGGVDDEWVPEAQFGFDWEQEISDSQRFYANIDVFPEWENFNNYRALSEMGLEIDLPRPSNTSLKLSASDRFDSHPDGVPPHITNYSVLLLWKR
ncbi:MAG: DUF481 domain-containing protein [Planctomycetota bacterium]